MKINTEVQYEIPEYLVFLRQARSAKKMTQEDIAKKLGITAMAVSHYEHGIREPKMSVLEKWLAIFGLRLAIEEIKSSP